VAPNPGGTITPDAKAAYVTNVNSGTVTPITTATNTGAGTIACLDGNRLCITAARRLGAKLASFAGMAEVVFAVLFAWLLLGQMPSPIEFTGGAFMLADVILVRIDETKRCAPT
jgi:hypothetical protein